MGVTTNPDLTGLPDGSITGNLSGGGGASGTPAVLLENNLADGTGLDYHIMPNDYYGLATQFDASASLDITHVIFTKMQKVGNPNMQLVCRVYSGAGPSGVAFDPANLLGESDPVNASTLVASTGKGSKTFTFSTPVSVSSGQTYCITLEILSTVVWDNSNNVVIYMQDYSLGSGLITGTTSVNGNSWDFNNNNDDLLMSVVGQG